MLLPASANAGFDVQLVYYSYHLQEADFNDHFMQYSSSSSSLLARLIIDYVFIVTVKSGHSKKDQKWVLKTDYRLMQVKSIAECSKGEHSAVLSTFIKL